MDDPTRPRLTDARLAELRELRGREHDRVILVEAATLRTLVAEIDRLRHLTATLAERVAAQSELLTRRTIRPSYACPHCGGTGYCGTVACVCAPTKPKE